MKTRSARSLHVHVRASLYGTVPLYYDGARRLLKRAAAMRRPDLELSVHLYVDDSVPEERRAQLAADGALVHDMTSEGWMEHDRLLWRFFDLGREAVDLVVDLDDDALLVLNELGRSGLYALLRKDVRRPHCSLYTFEAHWWIASAYDGDIPVRLPANFLVVVNGASDGYLADLGARVRAFARATPYRSTWAHVPKAETAVPYGVRHQVDEYFLSYDMLPKLAPEARLHLLHHRLLH